VNRDPQSCQAATADELNRNPSAFVALPITPGSKACYVTGWQDPTRTVFDIPDGYGVGNRLGGTTVFDADSPEAVDWCMHRGLHFIEHPFISQGRPERMAFWFRGEVEPYKVRIAPGPGKEDLEIRSGCGMQQVVAPTIHPDTKEEYGWIGTQRRAPVTPLELPLLRHEDLPSRTRQGPKAPSMNGSGPVRIFDGDRHRRLISLAGTMRAVGMSEAAMRAALLEENSTFDPPYEGKELEDEIEKKAIESTRSWHEDPSSGADDAVLPVYSLADIADTYAPPSWRVEGWWAAGSYGEIAGAEKTLKSYLSLLEAISTAAGESFLGQFPVRRQGPVLIFCGEGSRDLLLRRARHLARLYDLSELEVRSLPIHVVDGIRPVLSKQFLRTLEEYLKRFEPVLVQLDPLYAYHGSEKAAGNVYEATEILTALSSRTSAAGACLQVVNHFNKASAGKLSLASITQAGHREWSDSWVLVGHREPPDLETQSFQLQLEVGSRQWGGASWDLDISLGAFDVKTFQHTGPPSFELSHHVAAARRSSTDSGLAIREILRDHPLELTKTDVLGMLEGKRNENSKKFDDLAREQLIRFTPTTRVNARGHNRVVDLWEVGDDPDF
jgi:hypothetical protein